MKTQLPSLHLKSLIKKICTGAQTSPEVQVFTRVNDLPDEWDDGLKENHFLKRSSLAISEQSNLQRVTFIYVLLKAGDMVLAKAHFMQLHIREEHLNKRAAEGWKWMAWQMLHKLKKPSLLISGHLYRHDVEHFILQAQEPYEQYVLYKALIDEAIKHSKADAVLLKDINNDISKYFHHYAPEYLLLRNDISMELRLHEEWQTFQDYEKALKHKYAQRARKVRKAFTDVTCLELTIEEVIAQKQELYALYLQVSERQAATLGFISPDFIPNLKKAYDENFKLWAFYHEGAMVAFASAWVKPPLFDMFYIGFDYKKNQELQLYFNILFFSLEQAIAHQCATLILGRTALEAKARLGCKPHYLSTMLYIRNPLLRRLVDALQRNMHIAEGEWEQRHPLK